MPSRIGILFSAALVLLASVCHAAMGSDASDGDVSALAIRVDTNGDDTASSPDFDGDGTIGFGDFVKFAAKFGLGQGDDGYDAQYDLNGDGEIGFSDFVIFAQFFGTEVSSLVYIPDAKLRAAIEAALGKTDAAPITQAEMATLTDLEARNKNIRDLTGLEFATSLTRLDLRSVWVPTGADYNRISNLLPLSGLTNLRYLDLFSNDITDVSALSGLTNLTHLRLGWNEDITDISALAGLTNLERLDLRQTGITDISALAGLTRLQLLQLDNTKITDISALAGLTKLKTLSLYYCADVSDSDISVLSGLTNLESLHLSGTNIMDISVLAGLTKLKTLGISFINISDISVLAGLTKLEWLAMEGLTNVSDISVLSGLTNLKELYLMKTNITDISALAVLTKLEILALDGTGITDISALSPLHSLEFLNLSFNNISDISPLSGLTNLKWLDLRGNPLSDTSIAEHVSYLEDSGVEVLFDSFRKGDFDIDLVFTDAFTDNQQNVLQYVTRRWMAVISEDLPDYEFTQGWSGQCGDHSYTIPSGERIDDLRIYMTTFDDNPDAVGWGGPSLLRDETHLPVLGCMAFDLKRANLLITGLHEVGHVLGFGPIWDELGFYQNPPDGDQHFNGPLAIAAFDDAGGWNYTGKKVPVDGGHWRLPVLEGELMGPSGGGALSAITVQSFADLGYGVDVTQVDPFTLPGATQASAKIELAQPSVTVPGFDITWAYHDVLPGAERYGQGRIVSDLPSIVGDGRRTGLLESAERFWGRGINVNLLENRQMRREGSPVGVEPELTCGAGLMNEPIYVVDPLGHIVRTVSP